MAFQSRSLLIVSALLLSAVLASCAGKSSRPGDDESALTSRAPGDDLTESLARARRAQIRDVAYRMDFEFTQTGESFAGRDHIDVELARVDQPLSIDTVWKTLSLVAVNGRAITDYRAQPGSLEIPARYLEPHTVIEIAYEGAFARRASGVQRIVDPADQRVYIHTDFEPYHAHELFPCFDQPDLKARYEISVRAPADWKVIGNALTESELAAGAGYKITRFEPTEKISPYLVFVGAGPYHRWTDAARLMPGNRRLPLNIYTRESIASHVDAERLFETTRKGLAFYGAYFDYAYPFPKYDHVFVADYGHGAMENPGAVTMNEKMIFRGPVSEDRYLDRDDTMLHEMAHMWFGDLVTTAWWNDTWLNESFATYMSHVALAALGQGEEAWLSFNGSKRWATLEDQLVTTHPIEAHIPSAQVAMANFDGITYGKGASALKQLSFFVGENGFQAGVRAYFKKHQWANARRADFVAAVAEASGVDLSRWTEAWLRSAGLNRVIPQWSCTAGKLDSFELRQQPSSSGVLAPHRTEVALIHQDRAAGRFEMIDRFPVAYDGAHTRVTEAVGKPCPDLVFANFEDEDYALFALDGISLRTAMQGLSQLPDALLRQQIWMTLHQMVRDQRLPVGEYFALALRALPGERSPEVLAQLIGRHSSLRDAYWTYLSPAERDSLAPAWERMVWEHVASAPSRDFNLLWFDFYVSMAHSPTALAKLEALLKTGKIPGKFSLPLDETRRWNVVNEVARLGAPNAEKLIASEIHRDRTNEGRREAFGAQASIPDLANKRKLWAEILSEDELPWALRRQGLKSFNDPDRPGLSEAFVSDYFAAAERTDWASNPHLVPGFFGDFFPPLCTPALLERSRAALADTQDKGRLSENARRAWREQNDELERCIKVRTFNEVRGADRSSIDEWDGRLGGG